MARSVKSTTCSAPQACVVRRGCSDGRTEPPALLCGRGKDGADPGHRRDGAVQASHAHWCAFLRVAPGRCIQAGTRHRVSRHRARWRPLLRRLRVGTSGWRPSAHSANASVVAVVSWPATMNAVRSLQTSTSESARPVSGSVAQSTHAPAGRRGQGRRGRPQVLPRRAHSGSTHANFAHLTYMPLGPGACAGPPGFPPLETHTASTNPGFNLSLASPRHP